MERSYVATIINSSSIKKGVGPGTVSDEVKSHSNNPFVIKKVEEATKTIQGSAMVIEIPECFKKCAKGGNPGSPICCSKSNKY
jgi:hypothetical protein